MPSSPEQRRHDLRARTLEDAELRVAVGLERAVPVEVVRLEVEQHRDLAGELCTSSSWNDDSSQTTQSARTIDVTGVPTLPATATSRPAARKIAPSNSVVVVLPFVPVTPTNRASGSSLYPNSTSDQTAMPRRRASRTSAASPGTPGT